MSKEQIQDEDTRVEVKVMLDPDIVKAMDLLEDRFSFPVMTWINRELSDSLKQLAGDPGYMMSRYLGNHLADLEEIIG